MRMNFYFSWLTGLLLILQIAISGPINAQVSFGGGFALNTETVYSGFGPQAKLAIGLGDKLELNGNFTYYLRKETLYALDFDLHYKLLNISDKVFINPFAGMNFTRTTFTDSSLNIGVSFRFPTEKLTYYLEPKMVFDRSQFVLAFGILL
jgi:hypothetical protein